MKFSFALLLTLLLLGFSFIYSPVLLEKIPLIGALANEFEPMRRSLQLWSNTNLVLAVCFALVGLFYFIQRNKFAITLQKFILLLLITVHLVPFFFWSSASILSLDGVVMAAAHLFFVGFMLYAMFSSRALVSPSGWSV
ncbi:hypothetical protein [Paenibacillus chitinolyticus]|uniref:hypothetical protein n=1 Tax=Paenibacillus chitinolyticus TaxID=79263 RepID=UPI003629E030